MARKSASRAESEPITIDRAGRVVIPSPVRKRLHLRPGTRLTLSVEADRVILEPAEDAMAVAEDDGMLVATGKLVGDLVDHRNARDERTRKLGRW